MSEEIKGVIPTIMTRGIRGDLHCHLVFTSERIIVAVLGMLAQVSSGIGAFGAAGGVAYWLAQKKADPKLAQLSPEDILTSNKKNFSVSYSEITNVETGKKLGTSRLYVQTSQDIHKFKFQGVKLEYVEEAIRAVLPESLTLKRNDKLD